MKEARETSAASDGMLGKQPSDPVRLESRAAELIHCPFLGLSHDPQTHALFVSDEHRCFADPPRKLDAQIQTAFCLRAAYVSCPQYKTTPKPAGLYSALKTTSSAAGPRIPLTLGLTALAVAVAVILIVFVLTRGDDGAATPVGGGVVRTAPAGLASVAPTPTTGVTLPVLVPTTTPATVPLGTTVPGGTPLPPPEASTHVPTPSAARTYVVQQGDNLDAISLRFSVSVAEIMRLNSLQTTLIAVNQTLLLPPAPASPVAPATTTPGPQPLR